MNTTRWCYHCHKVIIICYIIYLVAAASEGSLYLFMCPDPGMLLGREEDQGNKKEGSWQDYGSWPGCKWVFCRFPLLWVFPGAAAVSLKGGCVFSGLQLYVWIDAWIFPESGQTHSRSTSEFVWHLTALEGCSVVCWKGGCPVLDGILWCWMTAFYGFEIILGSSLWSDVMWLPNVRVQQNLLCSYCVLQWFNRTAF